MIMHRIAALGDETRRGFLKHFLQMKQEIASLKARRNRIEHLQQDLAGITA